MMPSNEQSGSLLRLFRRNGHETSGDENSHYRLLRRNLTLLMLAITLVPLTVMAIINVVQYRRALAGEMVEPLQVLANKSRHSFELVLAERQSVVDFIASAYSFEELADEEKLREVYRVAREEFSGIVDLGLIDSNGIQISYVGPYDLRGRNYQNQSWFREVQIRDRYISDVFLGYREFPHLVIAVQRTTEDGRWWVVRATIDTRIFDRLIAAMGLGPESDAYLHNDEGILQTSSRFYGTVLETCPFPVHSGSWGVTIKEHVDRLGRPVMVAHSKLVNSGFILVVVKPQAEVLRAWYALKAELFYIFLISVAIIVTVIFRVTGRVVHRIRDSDEKRELALREIEHTQKLSSIGRLAAGVAHEINNPLAIINQKAGLLHDLVGMRDDYPDRDRFLGQINSIEAAVARCRTITHRLLGFARRMDVDVEMLDLNEVVREVVGFLEKEAAFRNIDIELHFADDLPRIASDRGQLQQVFLNIVSNALAAVDDGGHIEVRTWDRDPATVAVEIEDTGCGMDAATRARIFEPFFTTKRTYGTGLGLAITYGIVKKLGGEVTVDSQVGVGTSFTVILPKQSVTGEPA